MTKLTRFFYGRISALGYLVRVLILLSLTIISGLVAALGGAITIGGMMMDPSSLAIIILGGAVTMAGVTAVIAGIYYSVGISVQRLHDMGFSGWWVFPFYLAPGFFFFVLLFRKFAQPYQAWKLVGWLTFILGGPVSIYIGIKGDFEYYASAGMLTLNIVLMLLGIVTYFWRGQRSDNRFGPDPLVKQQALEKIEE